MRPAFAAAVLLLAAACAAAPPEPPAAVAEEDGLTFSMFETVLSDLQRTYLEEPPAGALTLAALGALESIDPTLTIENDGVTVRLLSNRTPVAAAARPPEDAPPAAWATMAAGLVAAAQNASGPVRDADPEVVFDAMFGAMTRSLDRYTRYAGAAAARENRETREGFGSVGVTVEEHPEGARVLTVTPAQPAAAAGVHAGDRIVAVDGQPLAGMALRRILRLLRGPVDRPVDLTLVRSGLPEPFTVTVGRTRIVPETVFLTRRERLAELRITGFNERTARRVAEAVGEVRSAFASGVGVDGLILDLRGNPGGLLDRAVDVADLFLDAGLISRTDGRHPRSFQTFAAEPGDVARGLRMVVLVDGASASAAEVVAAALQDHGRAVLVGTASFGKGTVQTVLRLPNGGELIVTWARLLAPSGYPLDDLGVMPTVCTTADAPAATLVRHAIAVDPSTTLRNLAQRRRAGRGDAALNEILRTLCPWRPREASTVEIEAAEHLLADPQLFDRAISLAAGPPA